jgi:hypothetical protein
VGGEQDAERIGGLPPVEMRDEDDDFDEDDLEDLDGEDLDDL